MPKLGMVLMLYAVLLGACTNATDSTELFQSANARSDTGGDGSGLIAPCLRDTTPDCLLDNAFWMASRLDTKQQQMRTRYEIAVAYSEIGDFERGKRIADGLEEESHQASAVIFIATNAARAGHKEQARLWLREGVILVDRLERSNRRPQLDPFALRLLAVRGQATAGDFAAAFATLGGPPEDAFEAVVFLQIVRSMAEAGRIVDALEALEDLEEFDAFWNLGLQAIAEAALAQRDHILAFQLADEATSLTSDIIRGQIVERLIDMEEVDSARTQLKRIEDNRIQAKCYRLLARSSSDEESRLVVHDLAMANLMSYGINSDDLAAGVLAEVAATAIDLDQREMAEDTLSNAVRRAGQVPELDRRADRFRDIAVNYIRLGIHDEGELTTALSKEREPGSGPPLWHPLMLTVIAEAKKELGFADEARRALRVARNASIRAEGIFPSRSHSLFRIARLSYELGETSQATEAFATAVKVATESLPRTIQSDLASRRFQALRKIVRENAAPWQVRFLLSDRWEWLDSDLRRAQLLVDAAQWLDGHLKKQQQPRG